MSVDEETAKPGQPSTNKRKEDDWSLHLVSGARPLARPSSYEVKRLEEVRTWIAREVLDDAMRPRKRQAQIDERRKGRILVVDGERGAGKTSFMLTMLERWQGPRSNTQKESWEEPIDGFKVLFPVLDFDPLPEGMPLHAWLLEPWRFHLKNDLGHRIPCEDLHEKLADLVDKAILGWTPAAKASDAGITARALAYREQTSGWAEMRDTWRAFVDAVVCRSEKCTMEPGHGDHKALFVIAIDDLDLQVEQIPNLLKAIRLLEHPNLLYILTGHLAHLKFAVELDYRGRHERIAGPLEKKQQVEDIGRWSDRLAHALVHKTLPEHATVHLPFLKLSDVCEFDLGENDTGSGGRRLVKERLGNNAEKLLKEPWASSIRFVTARKAQYAIDRRLPDGAPANADTLLAFLAALCGTDLRPRAMKAIPDPSESTTSKDFAIRGRLTTVLSQRLRVLRGDRLRIILHDQPRFAFEPDFTPKTREEGDEANRAAVVQLVTEGLEPLYGSTARQLHWNPDAGILVTEVDWRWHGQAAIARFHWPWLTRLTAKQVLDLQVVAERFAEQVEHGTSAELADLFLAHWLLEAIRLAGGATDDALPELATFSTSLGKFYEAAASNVKADIRDWARQLLILTAPYMGLKTELAWGLRSALVSETSKVASELQPKDIKDWQDRTVADAIEAGSGANEDVSGQDRAGMVKEFLAQRATRLDARDKQLWINPETGSFEKQETLAVGPIDPLASEPGSGSASTPSS